MGLNASGQQYFLYTGTYSGSYSRLFTGYMLRIVDADQTLISQTPAFTIDNEVPTLSGISLLSDGLIS